MAYSMSLRKKMKYKDIVNTIKTVKDVALTFLKGGSPLKPPAKKEKKK